MVYETEVTVYVTGEEEGAVMMYTGKGWMEEVDDAIE